MDAAKAVASPTMRVMRVNEGMARTLARTREWWAEGGAPRMSPPPRARSGTRWQMGSGSTTREREPTETEYATYAPHPQLPPVRAACSSAWSATRRASLPAIAAFETGGSAQRASSRSEKEGCSSRRLAASWSGRRKLLEDSALEQRPGRPELRGRRPALPDEVRVIRVGEPVGVGSQAGDETPLLEREHDGGRPCHRQVALDRLPALGIGGRVGGPVDDAHADPGCRGDAPDERGARVERRSHLEVG